MKLGKEHETACRGWEHPGLYEQCSRISALYGKARCAPHPAHALAGGLLLILFFFPERDGISTNSPSSPA